MVVQTDPGPAPAVSPWHHLCTPPAAHALGALVWMWRQRRRGTAHCGGTARCADAWAPTSWSAATTVPSSAATTAPSSETTTAPSSEALASSAAYIIYRPAWRRMHSRASRGRSLKDMGRRKGTPDAGVCMRGWGEKTMQTLELLNATHGRMEPRESRCVALSRGFRPLSLRVASDHVRPVIDVNRFLYRYIWILLCTSHHHPAASPPFFGDDRPATA